VLVRLFVVGIYTLPPESISMAPTLVPGAEGGDAIVLADLLAYRFARKPQRGDIVVFRDGRGELVVKRVMGLPREAISFRKGDLCVGGKVLVKDRSLLDRVKVPLLGISDYHRTDTGWETDAIVTEGFRLPGGSLDGPKAPAHDVVVLARVRARASPASIAFVLDDGLAKHTVVLDTGIDSSVYAGGVEVDGVSRELLRLQRGVERELWFTNADGSLRVQVDGREAAPAATVRAGKYARVSVVVNGEVELISLEVARDLVYDGPASDAKPDEYFVLGDNAARSLDSRTRGPIPEEWILGRAFAVAWPWSRARLLR